MPTRVITPPAVEPVTLAEVKAHLRIDFTDDDVYLSALISAARDYAEGFQHRSLVPQTLEYTDHCFSPVVRLRRGPVTEIVSVSYTAIDGSEQTITPADYTLTSNDELIPKYGTYWPLTIGYGDAVRIRYKAGYTDVPCATKQAMLLLIGHWYENRESVTVGRTAVELPLAATSLLWMDRTW
ncbi:head-tail connector protein [Paenibacillus sp. HJGM_3]|uniref:head-tail connector protein n=1 Tax=Paenibacillus sp. HJGM_3 TaxID=3379816 RepID=UPI003858608A